MKVLIIEDEPPAVKRLDVLLRQVGSINVAGVCDSVADSVTWLTTQRLPDLILMDIHLADGISFEIFDKVSVPVPVIFTTAYDEYAVKAFKVNSIDYLLKPIDEAEFRAALAKAQSHLGISTDRVRLAYASDIVRRAYKERFLIKTGDRFRTVPVVDILFFVSREHTTFAHTRDHRELVLDVTLDQIEALVDPNMFFRINRKFILHISAFQDVIAYSSNRLRVRLEGCPLDEMIVARERVADFKHWLDR